MKSPTVGSLFAGIGGFDLGFERAGFRVAWCVEVCPKARAILARHFPSAKIYGDIREVDAQSLERVDVICGGFPCQDLSVAGRRAGLAGKRSGLFYDAIRIVRGVNPRFAVIENVPGLLSSNNGHDFAAVLREMGDGGHFSETAWRMLDSRYFGVAQRRRRLFIVSSSRTESAAEILGIRESGGGNDSQGAETRKNHTFRIARSIADDGKPGNAIVGALDCRIPAQRVQNLISGHYLVDRIRVAPIQDGRALEKRQNGIGLGGMEDPSYTLDTTGGQSVFVSNANERSETVVRFLMPIECERLQGFPVGWTDGQPDSTRYRQLGNAVTVNVAEWIARRIQICL